jgi:hypothetical protein
VKLTPIQIALLALAYETYERDKNDFVAVWGSWQRAAQDLVHRWMVLVPLGARQGTRELEWRTLHGRHRRGPAGRTVHVYQLAHLTAPAVGLAKRCAWAVRHKSKDRTYVTWRDVPVELPIGRQCPACGCVPGSPCVLVLPNGCGEGRCVPAGMYGFKRCTACQCKEAA